MNAQLADRGLSELAASSHWSFRNQACYHNAAVFAYSDNSLWYVEGYAVGFDGLPLEHAWCESVDGKVIELTPVWLEDLDKNLYFAAIKLDRIGLGKKLNASSQFYTFHTYRDQFSAAMIAAHVAVFGPAVEDMIKETHATQV